MLVFRTVGRRLLLERRGEVQRMLRLEGEPLHSVEFFRSPSAMIEHYSCWHVRWKEEHAVMVQ